MDEYKSNSNKSKEDEKNIEKVITGSVKTKKKNEVKKFADVFISEDVENVKSYILMDVLIPAVKKALSDVITNGVDMILYGETGRNRRDSGSKPSYRSYYESNNSRSNTTSYRPTTRSAYSFEDIILENRADAEEVLDGMGDILDKYGVVSVADMYDLVGMAGNYTDNKYGWTDLRTARVERERDGSYSIRLPRALPL